MERLSRKEFVVMNLSLAASLLGFSACSGDSSSRAQGTGGSGSGTGGAGASTGGASPGTGGATGSNTGGSSSTTGGSQATGGSAGETGDAGAGGGDGANLCSAELMVRSSGAAHQHDLTIPLADITAGVRKVYQTSNEMSHSHWVELTAADFTALKAGMVVTKKTCSGGDHEYVLSCADDPPDPTLIMCPDTDVCGGSMTTPCPP